MDNFLTPQVFNLAFDFFVWDGKVDDIIGDFSGFIRVFCVDDEDYFNHILVHFITAKKSLSQMLSKWVRIVSVLKNRDSRQQISRKGADLRRVFK